MKFINLKKFRQERGLKQITVSVMTGISQSAVSYLENGYKEVTETHLKAFRRAFRDVDINEYVYEQYSYPALANQNKPFDPHQCEGLISPTPLDRIQGQDIIVKLGRINVTSAGDLFIDTYNGKGNPFAFGYYHIPAKSIGDYQLIQSLSQMDWLDDETKEHFKHCHAVACSIAGVK